MADFSNIYGGGGGSSRGGSPFASMYASSAPSRAPSSKKKKDDKPSGISGFFTNLGDDIRDLSGIPAGLYSIGKSAAHDAGKIAGFTGGDFQFDDIAKAAVGSYTNKGTPTGEYARALAALAQGDLSDAKSHYGKTWKAIYANPLAPMLDAATVATGGAGIAGRIAAKTAATTGSTRAMKIAGLQRVDAITPSTVRGISGPAGSFAAATRSIIDPVTKKTLYTAPVERNLLVRGRKNLVEKAYTKLPETNYMSPTRRGTRLGEAEHRRMARRDVANLEREYNIALGKLDTDDRDALVYIAQGFNTVERAQTLLKARAERVAAKLAEAPAGKGASSKKARKAADVEDLERDMRVIERVMPRIATPSPALKTALAKQQKVDDATQATFVRNMLRENRDMTPDDAKARIEARAQMPLTLVGITPNPGERPMILTHVVKKKGDAVSSGRDQSLERGMSTKLLDEEKATTGENWLNARYTRDPAVALTTHRVMFAKEQTFQRMERAISNAAKYDRELHADGLRSGKLHLIDKNDRLVGDMHYVDTSLNRFERDVGDVTDTQLESIREAYGAMYDLIDEQGSPGVVMSRQAYEELAGQFGGAKSLFTKLTDKLGAITKPWRHIVLSLKGSFYVNNFIGNMMLGIVAYGPRYILDVAQESLPAGLRGVTSAKISDNVADMTRTTGAQSISRGADEFSSKAARLDIFSRLGEKVAAKGALLTEDNFRRGAFRNNLRTTVTSYRAAHPKATHSEAVEAIFNDRRAIDQLAEATYGDLLDYSKLTPVEREFLLPLMPFWNFTRSMAGRTVRLTLDEPWKMRVLLYFGQAGIEANVDMLPEGLDLPAYLKGMIVTDPTGDSQRVVSTFGMNPFMAPVDLASQILSVAGKTEGSQSPLASFNPFIKAPLEALVGRDFFTQQDITSLSGDTPESYGGKLRAQMAKNIPQYAMLQRYRYPSKYPAVVRDASDTAAQYFGLPVGTLSTDNIEQVNAISAAMDAREQAYREKRRDETEARARF